jgi:hypothetical protein
MPEREHDDGHGHAHREPRISWLLVPPLFALIQSVAQVARDLYGARSAAAMSAR